jgi:hypothetical protein
VEDGEAGSLQANLDVMGRKYQSLYGTEERLSDHFAESVTPAHVYISNI